MLQRAPRALLGPVETNFQIVTDPLNQTCRTFVQETFATFTTNETQKVCPSTEYVKESLETRLIWVNLGIGGAAWAPSTKLDTECLPTGPYPLHSVS